jgi:hypothetical protein
VDLEVEEAVAGPEEEGALVDSVEEAAEAEVRAEAGRQVKSYKLKVRTQLRSSLFAFIYIRFFSCDEYLIIYFPAIFDFIYAACSLDAGSEEAIFFTTILFSKLLM